MIGSSGLSSTARSRCSTAAGKVAKPVVGPAETVDIVAVVRLQLHRLADVLHRLLQVAALIDPGIAEIVEHEGFIGRERERLLEIGFGRRPILETLVANAARIEQRPVILDRSRRQRERLGIVRLRLRIALTRAQDVAERIERPDIFRVLGDEIFELRLGFIDPLQEN